MFYISDKVNYIFDFLTENYALNDVELTLQDNERIIVKKYNVVGYTIDDDVFRLYETPSLNKVIQVIPINDIVDWKII